ncbi:MAG: DUF5683 domain-containing protein [Ignavibacteria bacterium]|nr:DUF5683 domain-containing protein [Ignavibacteria bacterium]
MRYILFLILIFSLNLFAEDNQLKTGNLKTDFRFSTNDLRNNEILINNDVKLKSPVVAGVLSALVPGAGEIYNGDYLKAILFLAVEGATIYLNHHYTNKGDNQTKYFQDFADEHWSVVRYAQWLNQWASALGGNANIQINPDQSLKPWERVNWNQLNQAERTIKEFSHTLYPHGHQQYYEMIGKYPQYSQGWDDSKFALGIYSVAGEYYYDTKGKFIYYSGLRGKANDYYNIADKALIVTITNHIISMIDAIISANRYNSKVKVEMSLERIQTPLFVEYNPQLKLKFAF